MGSRYVNVQVNPPSELEFSFTLEVGEETDPVTLAKAELFDRRIDPIGTEVTVHVRRSNPPGSPWLLVFHKPA